MKPKHIWIQSMNPNTEEWRRVQLIGPDGETSRREAVVKVQAWSQHARDHKGMFSNWRFRAVAI